MIKNKVIGSALQKGTDVYVYNTDNRLLFIKTAGSRQGDGLMSFTSGTVNIKRADAMYTYNSEGRLIGTRSL